MGLPGENPPHDGHFLAEDSSGAFTDLYHKRTIIVDYKLLYTRGSHNGDCPEVRHGGKCTHKDIAPFAQARRLAITVEISVYKIR